MYLLSWSRNIHRIVLSGCLLATCLLSAASIANAQYTKHSVFQAVDDTGDSTFTFTPPQRLKGVVLNNPEDMLDLTANYSETTWHIGGQWQIFIQPVEPDDWGGTCLWMGQNYGNLGFIQDPQRNYSNSQWEAELLRLNVPPPETEPFQAGDVIEVLARGSLFYKGKQNVNEQHWNTANKDFDITIRQRGHGLPTPIKIHLSDVKHASDNYIFHATDPDGNGLPLPYEEVVGCEKYQSQWVTLQGVKLMDGQAEKWAADATLMLSDATGRTFPMRLGLNAELAALTPPSGTFNVTGIFDQEADDARSGYQLWVTSPSNVPEPGSVALVVSAVSALLIFRLRRHRRNSA